MHKVLLSVFLSLFLILTGSSLALAFNSGAVSVGDLETGSIVGQPFKSLPVDIEFHILEIGGMKAIYPPNAILNLRNQGIGARAMGPVVFKVTNHLGSQHNFTLSADSAFAAPTSMQVNANIPAGTTKYIGIAVSDFTYVTAGGLLKYKCSLHAGHLGGVLQVLK